MKRNARFESGTDGCVERNVCKKIFRTDILRTETELQPSVRAGRGLIVSDPFLLRGPGLWSEDFSAC